MLCSKQCCPQIFSDVLQALERSCLQLKLLHGRPRSALCVSWSIAQTSLKLLVLEGNDELQDQPPAEHGTELLEVGAYLGVFRSSFSRPTVQLRWGNMSSGLSTTLFNTEGGRRSGGTKTSCVSPQLGCRITLLAGNVI